MGLAYTSRSIAMSDSFAIDLDTAKAMTDSFALSAGIRCRLISAQGETLYQRGEPEDECAYLKALPGKPPLCADLHLRGVLQAERLGGRYIYTCASDLAYCASPIIVGGALAGGLVAGPVLLVEAEDLLEDLMERRQVPRGGMDALQAFLTGIPQVEPVRMTFLSLQLFADCVCIGDNSRELLLRRSGGYQQRSIGQYIHQVKTGGQGARYPIEKERALFSAVSRGDRITATALLNELLGHIFFLTPDAAVSGIRVAELLSTLSRAAIHGGADAEAVLAISDQYIQRLRRLRSQEDVAQWLAQALRRYTALVFSLVDTRYEVVIQKAISYMQLNCERNLTLGEVAGYVGYSHSHFSKVFKEELGCSFRSQLNQLRVEKSKLLLLAGNAPMSEIYAACGFEDQSYFCKVFKRLVGVTPDRYRRQSRRIDESRERDRRQP